MIFTENSPTDALSKAVIPAKAGIQAVNMTLKKVGALDSRLRGNDDGNRGCSSMNDAMKDLRIENESMKKMNLKTLPALGKIYRHRRIAQFIDILKKDALK